MLDLLLIAAPWLPERIILVMMQVMALCSLNPALLEVRRRGI
jgi:hypothetical protein